MDWTKRNSLLSQSWARLASQRYLKSTQSRWQSAVAATLIPAKTRRLWTCLSFAPLRICKSRLCSLRKDLVILRNSQPEATCLSTVVHPLLSWQHSALMCHLVKLWTKQRRQIQNRIAIRRSKDKQSLQRGTKLVRKHPSSGPSKRTLDLKTTGQLWTKLGW